MFWPGEYFVDYKKAQPSPCVHNFHNGITDIKRRWQEAIVAGAPVAAIAALDQEGENYKCLFLMEMIEYCIRNDRPTISLHIEIQTPLWYAAHEALKQRREAENKLPVDEQVQSLHDALAKMSYCWHTKQ